MPLAPGKPSPTADGSGGARWTCGLRRDWPLLRREGHHTPEGQAAARCRRRGRRGSNAGHMLARRVPVPAARGGLVSPALRWSPMADLGGSPSPAARAAHRLGRHAARRGSAVLHRPRSPPNRRGPGRDHLPGTDTPRPRRSSRCRPSRAPTDTVADRGSRPGRHARPDAALDIDLPVIRGNDGYPLCDVAMYLRKGSASRARAVPRTCTPTLATGCSCRSSRRRSRSSAGWWSRYGRATTTIPLRDRRRPARPDVTSTTRSGPTPRSSGCRPRRARGDAGQDPGHRRAAVGRAGRSGRRRSGEPDPGRLLRVSLSARPSSPPSGGYPVRCATRYSAGAGGGPPLIHR